ncbi:hypothetical protein QR680_007909 [Steinernema hermaphroditum]|uniref:Uncharacterized protein n=1 Tax=Steinernema hermaphroditum TaxID=289476 RepID=A0AA39M630_9BILA|nr:hypothetical protein QR680_007909 [Steinernema hermaphroditum]
MCGTTIVKTTEKKWLLFLISFLSLLCTGYILYESLYYMLVLTHRKGFPVLPQLIAYFNIGICFLGFLNNMFVFFAIKFGAEARRGHVVILMYIIFQFYVFIVMFMVIILLCITLINNQNAVVPLAVSAPIFNIAAVSIGFFMPYYRLLKRQMLEQRVNGVEAPTVDMNAAVVHPCPHYQCGPAAVVVEHAAPPYEIDAPPEYDKVEFSVGGQE